VPRERRLQVFRRDDFEYQLAGGDVECGDAHGGRARVDGDDVVVATLYQPVVREDGTRRDGLDHRAPHDALGELRILDLLAALTGTPASGTSAAPPLLRDVSVRPSSRAASFASSSNIS
jgi:hypothetical protein